MAKDIETRLAEVEGRLAIRELASRYGIHIDDRDLKSVEKLFTKNAVVRSKDGVMNSSGRDSIIKLYELRYTMLGPTLHVAHDNYVVFDSPTKAHGMVTSHAEVWRNEQAQIAAIRYDDKYEVEDGVWKFAERVLSFFYYMPVGDYATALGDLYRNRTNAEPKAADFPELGPWWVDMRPQAKRA
jgi:hypothetical protein